MMFTNHCMLNGSFQAPPEIRPTIVDIDVTGISNLNYSAIFLDY